MRDALGAVEAVFRELGEGSAQNRPRQRVRVPGRMLHTMSASSAALGYLGLKTYLTGRDGMRFVLLLFDQETGSLAAVMEADALGQIRTGAATGVAADYLAAPGASSVGIVGCGYQAETQLEALALVRPLTRVEAYCRNPERRTRFARKMSARLGVEIVPAASGEAAVRGKPIVVAVTNATEPVVRGAWLAPGCVRGGGGRELARTARARWRRGASCGPVGGGRPGAGADRVRRSGAARRRRGVAMGRPGDDRRGGGGREGGCAIRVRPLRIPGDRGRGHRGGGGRV